MKFGVLVFLSAISSLSLVSAFQAVPWDGSSLSIHIDADFKVELRDPLTPSTPPTGSYYSPSHYPTFISVEHLFQPEGQKSVRLLTLNTTLDHVLEQTDRTETVIRTQYGDVISTRACAFGPKAKNGYNGVMAGVKQYEADFEIPRQLTGKPANLPALTSLSLVRILQTTPAATVVTANYETDGAIGTLVTKRFTAANLQLFPRTLDEYKTYGIPISIAQWITSGGRLPFASPAQPELAAYLIRHYNYDEFIEVSQLQDDEITSSIFYQPTILEEERTLNPICFATIRGLHAQGESTVMAN